MKSLKVGVALLFIAGFVGALVGEAFGYPPMLVKAKKFGAKDCTFCHVDPDGGPPWNERGQFLIAEKAKRGADTVEVEWLADYKPGKSAEHQKPADAAKPDAAKPADAAKPDAAKADDKKPSAMGKADPKTFDDYVGTYEAPIGILDVTHEGEKLFGQPRGDSKEELIPQDDGSFSVTNVGAKVRFTRDDKGKVIEMVINLNGQEMKGKKIK